MNIKAVAVFLSLLMILSVFCGCLEKPVEEKEEVKDFKIVPIGDKS